MNEKLLKQVIQQIQEEPASLFMGAWILTNQIALRLAHELNRPRPVNTLACIYGWGLLLSHNVRPEEPRAADAARLFDLTEEQARALIYPWYWPEPFDSDYTVAAHANDVEGIARVAVARINYLLEKGA